MGGKDWRVEIKGMNDGGMVHKRTTKTREKYIDGWNM